MSGGVVTCPAGVWTRVVQTPTLTGFVRIVCYGPVNVVSYRMYSSSVPFYVQSTRRILKSPGTDIFVGPSPYVEIWINPPVTTRIGAG